MAQYSNTKLPQTTKPCPYDEVDKAVILSVNGFAIAQSIGNAAFLLAMCDRKGKGRLY
jgi:hypothetical protein